MKRDYAKMLASLSEGNCILYNVISQNDDYICNRLYTQIVNSVSGCCEIFINTRNEFVQWLTNCTPDGECFTYFDTILIGFLYNNPNFCEAYKDSPSNTESLIAYLLAAWNRRTKTLKQNLTMSHMIYLRYTRFIASSKGQDFLYGNSIELYPQNISELVTSDSPFYDQYVYRMEQLIKFKKHVLLKLCKTPLQNIEMRALWDVTFDNGKFSYKRAAELVRKQVSDQSVSNTALYYHLKRLYVQMLEEIVKDENISLYFDEDMLCEIDGKYTTFKDAIKSRLLDAVIEFDKAKKEKTLSNVQIADVVESYCINHGVMYTRYKNSSPTVLVKVKSDYLFNRKKGWNLYFLKGGGFIDFSTGEKGFVTDLIPKQFFKQV